MGNVLSREKREQVIALGRLGWPLRKIEEATGVRRETASVYLREAGIAIRRVGSWGEKSLPKAASCVTTDSSPGFTPEIDSIDDQSADDSKAATGVTTDYFAGTATAKCSISVCAPYRETILGELSRGRNAMGIWQDLVDSRGFAGGYQSVKRFVRKLRGATSPEARVVIETRPAKKLQVDYGTGPMVRDPQSGKYRRTRMFVLTLGYSRKSVRLLCWRSSTRFLGRVA